MYLQIIIIYQSALHNRVDSYLDTMQKQNK